MKKKTIKALSAFCVCLILMYAFPVGIYAEDLTDFSSKAKAIYLYSCNSERAVYCVGEQTSLPVGPTAKIITGLIGCELLEKDADKTIVISPQMLENVIGNSMGLEVGMKVTAKDLLYGTICGGNNDAAQALAVVCSGSVSAFVEKMNAFADKLYMQSTQYSNPSGVDSSPSKTTISDVAKLTIAASKNPLYMEISSASSYQTSVNGIIVYNRNALISQFSAQGYLNKDARGIIAGSTESGGFSLATLAQKNGISYICIVMGAVSQENEIYSYRIANELLDSYFKKYSLKKVASAGQNFGSLDVKLAIADKNDSAVCFEVPNDVYALLPKEANIEKDLHFKSYLHEKELCAPIEKGECIGGIDIYYGNTLVAQSALVTETDIIENRLLSVLYNMRNFFQARFFIMFIVILSISLTVYLCSNSRRKNLPSVKYKKFY